MIRCKINGKDRTVKEGTKLIDAFSQADSKLAHYCYHPGLSVAGCCRLCIVKIEGNPKLQIACNTVVTEGMVASNQDGEVKEAVKWGLDFHLINHPLDCPICDQAGECELQNQYMQFGAYAPEMDKRKVKKTKVVSLGSKIVLDKERCILCSRCVRFTDEVTKTHELGIFKRGDHSEVGTFKDKPLENNYALNTVDICPVGALTSKEFRFKQRVWYLESLPSICTGCSTGCAVVLDHNQSGYFRVRPRHNPKNNGYWMCDEGRDIFRSLNKENRLLCSEKLCRSDEFIEEQPLKPEEFKETFTSSMELSSSVAIVLTGQYSVEDYKTVFQWSSQKKNIKGYYHWVNNSKSFNDFDDILCRGDKNPNTKGLQETAKEFSVSLDSMDALFEALASHQVDTVLFFGPEQTKYFSNLKQVLAKVSEAKKVFWLTAVDIFKSSLLKNSKLYEAVNKQCEFYQVPLMSFIERGGTYINFQGVQQDLAVSPYKVFEDAFSFAQIFFDTEGKPLTRDKPSGPSSVLDRSKELHRVQRQRGYLDSVKENYLTDEEGGLKV